MTKTVLITGTSSGLGKATARLFQSRGWNVIATMRNPDAETELVALPRLLVTRLDVEDATSITTAVEAGIEVFGRIDVLVNNAGYGAYGPLEAFSSSQIRRQFEVNVLGLLDVTRAVLPHFRANKGGTIINIGSVGGKITFPLGALYHGTKFAVEGISEALQYELATFGGRVKLIEPGGIKTDFAGRSLDFTNDPALVEYQPLVTSLMAAFEPLTDMASPPETIAETVFAAAIDNGPQLRFVAGEDARGILARRQTENDETFLATMRETLNL